MEMADDGSPSHGRTPIKDGLVDDIDVTPDVDMNVDEESSALDAQTSQLVEELISAVVYV
ncbi:hypothetical protein QJS04_geneDACA022569 [Acorus gramineus]|uniref:Uncharacterized protein n=1 Tax=Acorus gramineus TaxID=55184 RepID=A0AAV9BAJ0_ACOGR|nr:hypothetical protein QJS04_geneDACA022569 [Acorus gramineus]